MSARCGLPLIAVAALGLGLVVVGVEAGTTPPSMDPDWHQVTLVGMVLREAGPSFAIIEDSRTGKPAFYPLGAAVRGARLTRILPDRVVLTLGGARVVLRLAVAGARSLAGVEEASPNSRSDEMHAAGRGRRLLTVAAPEAAPPGAPPQLVRSRDRDDVEPDSDGPQAVAGGDASGAGSAEQVSGGPSAQVRFAGLHHDGTVRAESKFGAGELRDLHIDVDYFHVSGTHRQRLEFYSPDGSLYQQRSSDVTLTTGQAVQTRVPVGGTWITEHTLFGTWQVRVYLDASPTPIATGTFALTQ